MHNNRIKWINKRLDDLNIEINLLHRELTRIRLKQQAEKLAEIKPDQKFWCEQCDRMVFGNEVKVCSSKFCKLKG